MSKQLRILMFAQFFVCFTIPSMAQVDVGTSVGPDVLMPGDSVKEAKLSVYPLALATSLAFGATTWAAVQISTATPAKDLSEMIRLGYYKLELFQMVILARNGNIPLKQLVAKREKGVSLRDLAAAAKLDYDFVYDQSLVVQAKVDRILPRIMTVSVLPASRY